jgi:1-acyl-sn-glycerol-3-phosphate acyltransferase
MALVRSALFNLFLAAWLLLAPFAVLPLLALPRVGVARLVRAWFAPVAWVAARLVGLEHVVRGREHLPEGPCIIAANHQSTWETLMVFRIVRDPAVVLKRELAFTPFGWFPLRAGGIVVDRKGKAAALRRMVRRARRALARGQPVVIFPQGTRTAPGAHRPLQPGIAALYAAAAVPVVPMALNSGLFWGRRAFRKRPGTIVVEFLPPIPPGLDRRAFMERLAKAIEGAAERLTTEARTAHSETYREHAAQP